jgi:predicted nucleic acid-binding protein
MKQVPMQRNYRPMGQRLKLIFLAVQVFGKTGTSIRNPYALRHGYSLNHKVSIPDMLIAATAISHELCIFWPNLNSHSDPI